MTHRATFSFVVPFHNEEDSLPLFLEEMAQLMEETGEVCEVILVDDGSQDDGARIVAHRVTQDPRIRLLRLSRNFGHQVAVTAGLDEASGKAVIIMDSDLQDPPAVVHELIDEWRKGFDIVHARRSDRTGESWFKRQSAVLFYRLLSLVASVEIPENVGDFRLVDARVVDAVRSMPERHRFLRGMFAWVGFRVTHVDFQRPARTTGRSKYPFRKMLDLAFDGLLGFSDAPLRTALWAGLVVSLVALLYGGVIFVWALFTENFVEGWASTVVILAFLSGVILVMNGVIGLYVARILSEVRQRPLYLVAEKIGFEEDDGARSGPPSQGER